MSAAQLVTDLLKAELGTQVTGVYFHHAPRVEPPFITILPIIDAAINDLTGEVNARNERIQIDVWSNTYDSANKIEVAVKSALESAIFTSVRLETNIKHEETSQYYRIMLEYSIWYT